MLRSVARERRRARRIAAQVPLHQRHAGALDRDVAAGAHRDADLGQRERRRVVHPVARHRDAAALPARAPRTTSAFCSGSTSATTSSIPSWPRHRLRPSRARRRSASRGAGPRRAARAPPRRWSPSPDRRRRAARQRARPARRRPPSCPRARSASARSASGPSVDAERLDPGGASERRRACPPTRPATPAPGMRAELLRRRRLDRRAARRPRRSPPRAGARFRARGWRRHAAASLRRSRSAGDARRPARGRPSVSVPVLSKTSVSIPRSRSIASASRKSTPALAPRPIATMIDIGVASPSAQGQAMISTATAFTSACASRGSGPKPAQTRKVSGRDHHHGRHEPGRHPVGQALDRRAAALGLGDQRDDPREQRLARRPARRASARRAGAVHGCRPSRDRPARFSTGIGSPVSIDSSTALSPSSTTPSTGSFSPGRTRRRSPTRDARERHVDLASVRRAGAARVGGASAEQRADRGAGPPPGPQLEHLAEQHERHDHGGRLEVDRHLRRRGRGTSPGTDPGASVASTL